MFKILGPLPYPLDVPCLGTLMSSHNMFLCWNKKKIFIWTLLLPRVMNYVSDSALSSCLVLDLFSNVCFRQTSKTVTNTFCSFQVNLRMTHKLVFYTETSSTNSATVRFFSCMYSHMSLYIYSTVKTPVTKITREFPYHPSLVLSPQAWIWNKEMAQC